MTLEGGAVSSTSSPSPMREMSVRRLCVQTLRLTRYLQGNQLTDQIMAQEGQFHQAHQIRAALDLLGCGLDQDQRGGNSNPW